MELKYATTDLVCFEMLGHIPFSILIYFYPHTGGCCEYILKATSINIYWENVIAIKALLQNLYPRAGRFLGRDRGGLPQQANNNTQ